MAVALTAGGCVAAGGGRDPAVAGGGAKIAPQGLSTIRGTNYSASGAGDNVEFWRNYDPKETERNLGYSDKLKLNQWRVFVSYPAWMADKGALRRNLTDLCRAANRHHVGVMVTLGTTTTLLNT